MSQEPSLLDVSPTDDIAEALQWLARVLTNFAKAEQAVGQLSSAMNLPIRKGLLGSLDEVIDRMESVEDRHCQNLSKRIVRWRSLRPVRHLLAHATLRVVYDESHEPLVVTRHLPLDQNDVTPDRVWTQAERIRLLRIVTSDGRSISDQVNNVLERKTLIARLRKG